MRILLSPKAKSPPTSPRDDRAFNQSISKVGAVQKLVYKFGNKTQKLQKTEESRFASLPVEIAELVFTFAASDRPTAWSLSRVSRHVRHWTTSSRYHTTILLTFSALSKFHQYILTYPSPSLTPHIHHLWIGPRTLHYADFYQQNPWTRATDNDVTRNLPVLSQQASRIVESLLAKCPNLLSLAIPVLVENIFGDKFKFNLIELVTLGNFVERQMVQAASSFRTIKRLYCRAQTLNNPLEDPDIIPSLPNLEILEVYWVRLGAESAPLIMGLPSLARWKDSQLIHGVDSTVVPLEASTMS
jgi:hypothetical protein